MIYNNQRRRDFELRNMRSSIAPYTLAIVLGITGAITRLAPILSRDSLYWVFPTEDSYLLMTIADNLAAGRGITVSDGYVGTNGFQPLFMFLQAILAAITDSDYSFVLSNQIVCFMFSVILSVLLTMTSIHVFKNQRALSVWLGALLFAAPVPLRHTMNGLETGMHASMILLFVLLYHRYCHHASVYRLGERVLLIVTIAASVLTRFDAIIFYIAFYLARQKCKDYAYVTVSSSLSCHRALPLCVGLVALLVWVMISQAFSSTIVPTSVTAQALEVSILRGAYTAVVAVLENAILFSGVPSVIEANVLYVAIIVSMVLVVIVIVKPWGYIRAPHIMLAMYCCVLFIVAYSSLSSAYHFFSRYMFPVTPLIMLAVSRNRYTVSTAENSRGGSVVPLAIMIISLYSIAGCAYMFMKTHDNLYKPMVEWVGRNVAEDTWIASRQSGTLGYFHKRTINLDGKVDARALRALVTSSRESYLDALASEGVDIQYIVDWPYILKWVQQPDATDRYDVYHIDPDNRFVVLRVN